MTLTFISHQWKSFWRSHNTGKNVVVNAVSGIFALYILLNLLLVSFFLDRILHRVFPGQDVIATFNGFLLYYFFIDLLMRYQFQELPALSVKPYLHLPVKRDQIINYLSFTSLLSLFTFAPFVLTIPFLSKVLLPGYGAQVFAAFVISIAGLCFFNHFFMIWLKRKENINSWFMLLFLALIAGLAFMDFYLHLISISYYSGALFRNIMIHPAYSAIPLAAGLFMFAFTFRFLKNNLYLEEIFANTSSKKSKTEYPLLNRFGKAGYLTANELKLIFRNKRSRSTVLRGVIFLFYGLIFYGKASTGSNFVLLSLIPMIMTGIFIINYGQFMFSWQGDHFDGILANKISIEDFFRSKFLLFTLFSSIAFILTTPYVYFGWKILMMQTIMYLWNIGVNAVLVLYLANFNRKRIDLSKSASFRWEGMGATQWILGICMLPLPYIVYLPFYAFGYPDAGLTAIGIIGIICILTRKFWLDILVSNFNKNRFQIAEGFRTEL